MVTKSTCTVYDCGSCGRPVYFRHGSWFHMGLPVPCDGLTLVEVRLSLPPARDRATA